MPLLDEEDFAASSGQAEALAWSSRTLFAIRVAAQKAEIGC